MAEYRSLDEFATESSADDAPDPAALPDLSRTYRSSPTEETCTSCGQQAATFWHIDRRWVCPACKEW